MRAAGQRSGNMQIIACLTDPRQAADAQKQGADIIELRLDLMEGNPEDLVRQCKAISKLPVIATLRSAQQGGRYFGNPEEWEKKITPVLHLVDYVDIEQQFARGAMLVKAAEKTIIASHHETQMMPLHVLFVLEQELRSYGDIPKIVITPAGEDDIIDLIAFTRAAKKPICTGVMGTTFRYARAVLPLFGSDYVYCHTGTPTAPGQYSVAEFMTLKKLLFS